MCDIGLRCCEMAESTKVLALLLEVGLLQVRIRVAAKG